MNLIKNKNIIFCSILLILILYVPYANGEMFVYFGEKDKTKQEPYKKIVANSVQFGLSASLPTESKSGSGFHGFKGAEFGELTISKTFDQSSLELFQQTLTGKNLPKVEISLISDSPNSKEYGKLILYDTVVTSYSSAFSENSASENVSFFYSKIQTEYITFSEGKVDKTFVACWDVIKKIQCPTIPSQLTVFLEVMPHISAMPDDSHKKYTFTATSLGGSKLYSQYQWDLDGDGEFEKSTFWLTPNSSPVTTIHTYSDIGSFNPTVKVIDSDNNEAISEPILVVISSETSGGKK